MGENVRKGRCKVYRNVGGGYSRDGNEININEDNESEKG